MDTKERTDRGNDLYEQGLVYGKEGKSDKAIESFTKALKLDPRNKEAYLSRGFTYHLRHEYDAAIKDYNAAIGVDPEYAKAYDYRGNSYNAKSEFKMALKDYAKALEINPNSSVVYYDQGNVYAKTGKPDAARSCLQKYLTMQPSEDGHMIPWALYSLACLYALDEETDEALRYFELALENGLRERRHIEVDTDLDPIREEPRFIKLMDKYFPEAA